jgi:ribosome-binding factor A
VIKLANYRGGRINEEIRRELSNIIQNELKDPRLTAMISVTQVEVTKDLRYAKVYVSIFGKDEEQAHGLAALKSSAGFMRKEIGHRVNLRHTPELIIELDKSIEHGMHMETLFHSIKEKYHDNK